MTNQLENDDFVLLFLDGESERVHAEQVEEIDLFRVLLHLNNGGSVFISNRKRKRNAPRDPKKKTEQRYADPSATMYSLRRSSR